MRVDPRVAKSGVPLGRRAFSQKLVSAETRFDTGSESIVQQQFKEECDINTIVARFGLTAQVPAVQAAAVYGDFSGVTDFHSALEKIEQVRGRFMSLPADLRERFGNDPGELVSFVDSASPEEFARRMAPASVVEKPSGGEGQ